MDTPGEQHGGARVLHDAGYSCDQKGAQTKRLLIRPEDVQVLYGFRKAEHAKAYLKSSLFAEDVVRVF